MPLGFLDGANAPTKRQNKELIWGEGFVVGGKMEQPGVAKKSEK